jgi:hypothetical protein
MTGLVAALRRQDPHYAGLDHWTGPRRTNQARRNVRMRQAYQGARLADRRTQEERDRATLGKFHAWAVGALAEERNAARVAKAQAALRWRRRPR